MLVECNLSFLIQPIFMKGAMPGAEATRKQLSPQTAYSIVEKKCKQTIITLCILSEIPGDMGDIREGFLEVVLSEVLQMG